MLLPRAYLPRLSPFRGYCRCRPYRRLRRCTSASEERQPIFFLYLTYNKRLRLRCARRGSAARALFCLCFAHPWQSFFHSSQDGRFACPIASEVWQHVIRQPVHVLTLLPLGEQVPQLFPSSYFQVLGQAQDSVRITWAHFTGIRPAHSLSVTI